MGLQKRADKIESKLTNGEKTVVKLTEDAISIKKRVEDLEKKLVEEKEDNHETQEKLNTQEELNKLNQRLQTIEDKLAESDREEKEDNHETQEKLKAKLQQEIDHVVIIFITSILVVAIRICLMLIIACCFWRKFNQKIKNVNVHVSSNA